MRRAVVALVLLFLLTVPAAAQEFSFLPPGTLQSGSGTGLDDDTVYAPGMRFPIEEAPAYANSQVWGRGGSQGGGGAQCDTQNFSYPWKDNYCETRSWDMPLCPSGKGHQGQDIRAASCTKDVHWVVAAEAGRVTSIGSYSVYVTADDGTRFDYLHMSQVAVAVGDRVTRGQRLGKVSNAFDGTPTTVHLHFNIRQNVAGVGMVYVSPYMSLVESYRELIGDVTPDPPDAGVPPGPPDASIATDGGFVASLGEGDIGGGCSLGGNGSPSPGPPLMLLLAIALLLSAKRAR